MIKVALYKRRKGIYNHLIYHWQFLTNAREYRKYTHTELIVDGIWYTASYRSGVRKRRIKENNEHWDFHERETTAEQRAKLHEFFEMEMNKGYDWLGIGFSQALPLDIGDPDRWFCSEIVYASLVYAGIIPRHKHAQWYSPARLAQYIKGVIKW